MIETMGPICNRTREHLGTSDTAIISMRHGSCASHEGWPTARSRTQRHIRSYRVRSAALLLDRGIPFDEGAREKLISPA